MARIQKTCMICLIGGLNSAYSVPISLTCLFGGWKKQNILPQMVVFHCDFHPMRSNLLEKSPTKQTQDSWANDCNS